MIYIEDYRSLPVNITAAGADAYAELMGQNVSVRTAAGAYTGVAVGEDARTLTLAYIITVRGRRQNRRVIIAKRHIIAVETVLR